MDNTAATGSLYSPDVSNNEKQWFEAFRRYIVPIMGVGEAIASRGQSPGTAAMNVEKNFQNQEDRKRNFLKEEEDRMAAAIERAAKQKQADLQEKIYNEQLATSAQEREAKAAAEGRFGEYRKSIEDVIGAPMSLPGDQEGPMSPEDQTAAIAERDKGVKALMDAFVQKEYPKDYIDYQMKASQPDFYDKLAATFANQSALEGMRQAPEKTKEAEKKERAARDRNNITTLIDDIVSDPNLGTGLDWKRFASAVPGTPYYASAQRLEQMKDLMSINGREKLQGSGAISDFESKMLARSQSVLSKNLGKEDLFRELSRIRNLMSSPYNTGKDGGVGSTKTPTTDKYTVGKIYKDTNGNSAKYLGNGNWEEVQ